MNPLSQKRLNTIRIATAAAVAALTLTACTAPAASPPPPSPDQQARVCAQSIASAPAGHSIMTAACRDHGPSLAVLAAAQDRYNGSDTLIADLTAKLAASEETVTRLTKELADTAARTEQARQDLLAAQDEVSAQTASRIRTNLETQAVLEDSSIDVAGATVTNVQTRIDQATELEQNWMTRYLELEEQYNILRDQLATKSTELLTAQILLDQERAEFDRAVSNAILTGTREERERLETLQQEATTLYDAAQAAIAQALADLEHAAQVASRTAPGTDEAAAAALRSAACNSAWDALRLRTLARDTSAERMDQAWLGLTTACRAR